MTRAESPIAQGDWALIVALLQAEQSVATQNGLHRSTALVRAALYVWTKTEQDQPQAWLVHGEKQWQQYLFDGLAHDSDGRYALCNVGLFVIDAVEGVCSQRQEIQVHCTPIPCIVDLACSGFLQKVTCGAEPFVGTFLEIVRLSLMLNYRVIVRR